MLCRCLRAIVWYMAEARRPKHPRPAGTIAWLVVVASILIALVGGGTAAGTPAPAPPPGPAHSAGSDGTATAGAPTLVSTSRSPRASTASSLLRATSASTLLKLGSRGRAVRDVQRRLVALSYLPTGAADGIFGRRTWHAVVALQGWSGLARDGVVGPRTRRALARAGRPVPWSRATGMEIHLRQQVLLLISNRRVLRAIHIASGKPGWRTPAGHFKIYSRQTMSWSVPFHTWMPLAQYFYRGYALHEYADVPAYPASHGCVRVPQQESQTVWRFGRIGMRVWTTR